MSSANRFCSSSKSGISIDDAGASEPLCGATDAFDGAGVTVVGTEGKSNPKLTEGGFPTAAPPPAPPPAAGGGGGGNDGGKPDGDPGDIFVGGWNMGGMGGWNIGGTTLAAGW